jgi:diguanylate cyclase (GGDEF)-like protein
MSHSVYSSILDNKTPLYSQLGFLFFGNQLRQEICESGREGWLVFMDVDHLNQISVDYGSETSHAALVSVALAIREIFPAPAVAARLGPDEFAILLSAPKESEEMLLSRFNEALNNVVARRQFPCAVTAAVGIERSGIRNPFDLDQLLWSAASKAISKKNRIGRIDG